MMWLMGISHATMGAQQAMGKAKSAFVLVIQRRILLITPMILILPYLFNLGLDGVWLAFPLADLLGAIISLLFLYVTFRKQKVI
jgi:Na+-driven multidrug efflux pump